VGRPRRRGAPCPPPAAGVMTRWHGAGRGGDMGGVRSPPRAARWGGHPGAGHPGGKRGGVAAGRACSATGQSCRLSSASSSAGGECSSACSGSEGKGIARARLGQG
jgi:hypothetical protein